MGKTININVEICFTEDKKKCKMSSSYDIEKCRYLHVTGDNVVKCQLFNEDLYSNGSSVLRCQKCLEYTEKEK